jgi:FAD/FMN-containing dehydrogenase
MVDSIVDICRRNASFDIRVAGDEAERARLWLGRKGAFGAMGRISPDMIVMDAVIPRTRLPEVLGKIEALAARYDLPVANVFHAGDGNLHPLILFDSRDPDQVDRIHRLGEAIMQVCVAVGGALSGEHGIGLEKKEFMPMVFEEHDLEVMRSVKAVFNPSGLLNPGKIFPTGRACTEVGPGIMKTDEARKRIDRYVFGSGTTG